VDAVDAVDAVGGRLAYKGRGHRACHPCDDADEIAKLVDNSDVVELEY
jgi:hypothetical protein